MKSLLNKILILITSAFLMSCFDAEKIKEVLSVNAADTVLVAKNEAFEEDKIHIVKEYYPGRILKKNIEARGNQRHGLSTQYYKNGIVHSEINYRNNKKHGSSKWYYTTGKLYRETLYDNGKKHGNQTKYYANGKISAIIPYENGKLIVGTKEYSKNGILFNDYPTIMVKVKDNVKMASRYEVEVELSNKSKIVQYFFSFGNNNRMEAKSENGKSLISIYCTNKNSPPSTLKIFAEYKTSHKNYYLIEKTIEIPFSY